MAPPHPFRRPIVLAAAIAAAAAFPAGAGIPLRDAAGLPMRWTLQVEQPNVKGGKISYYLDPQTSTEELPGEETERDAIIHAAETWEQAPGSLVRFLSDDTRFALDRNATDRVNYIGWKSFALGPFTLSATYTSAKNGVITDSDIIFNDTVDFVKWATTTPGLSGYADVQAVATHELGHVLGLDHSPVATSSMSFLQSLGTINARSLAPDDIGAVLAAYPTSNDPTTGTLIGTVSLGRRPSPRGLPVFALDARSGDVRSCSLTDDNGVFRIGGLPPGPYRVAAAPFSTLLPFSRWWANAPLKVVAGYLEETLPDGTTAPRTVFVRAGYPEVGLDFRVGKYGKRTSGEPDDDPFTAREIPVGGSATGVFETFFDEDWFRVTPHGTDRLDVRVRSWGLGAAADPEMAILAADGATVLAYKLDLRPTVDAESFHGPLGPDKDAVFEGFVPPATGDILIRVRAQPQSDIGGPGSFYLVEVAPSAGVPDARRSTAVCVPSATRAGEGPPPTLTAIPRDWRGDPVGPGATVTALRSDGGDPIPLVDGGDGSYAGTVPLPGGPGEVRFTLDVQTPGGSATVPDAATLTVAGPADASRSALDATPRRVEADGDVPVTLVFTPRDAEGRLLGPGLDVAIVFDGPGAGTLGAVTDRFDGTYAMILGPAPIPSSARVTATIDGQATGRFRRVGFGWSLPLVASDLGAAVVESSGTPGVSKQEVRAFGAAGEGLDGILAALADDDDLAAATAASRAVAALTRAGKSPLFSGGAAAAADVAEALRRQVHGIVDVIVFAVPDPQGQATLGAAKVILARGDAALASGNVVGAAKSFVKALRKATPLL